MEFTAQYTAHREIMENLDDVRYVLCVAASSALPVLNLSCDRAAGQKTCQMI
jgi:hypothetical protein